MRFLKFILVFVFFVKFSSALTQEVDLKNNPAVTFVEGGTKHNTVISEEVITHVDSLKLLEHKISAYLKKLELAETEKHNLDSLRYIVWKSKMYEELVKLQKLRELHSK